MQTDPDFSTLRDALIGHTLVGTDGLKYHVLDCIGEGSQGWVFRAAWDDPDGALVIVKALRPDAMTDTALARFVREALVLQQLGQNTRPNPYIVRFFSHAIASVQLPGTGLMVNLPFTVMEYVRGSTLLAAMIQMNGVGMPAARVRRIMRQVASALETVHAQKIVHRDLKPSNILLESTDDREVAKVTDFGLVKVVNVGPAVTTSIAGASLGYAPPEQFEQGNERVTPRTDVFSFAAVLFELLTSQRAFVTKREMSALELIMAVINGPRPSLVRSRAVLSPELAQREDVLRALDAQIIRGLQADPDQRHASIAELWASVEPLLCKVIPTAT